MILGLEDFKQRIRKDRSNDCWVKFKVDDMARMAEWMLGLEDRIEELERK